MKGKISIWDALAVVDDIILTNRIKEYYALKDKLAVTPIADVRDVTDAIRELEDRILKQTSATRTAKNREEMYSKEGLAKSIKDDKERLSLRGAMMKKYFDS